MDFFNIGDAIGYNQYNAIVYMLRKFKRLTSKLRLGQSTITSDYGTYNIMGGLISIEGNWILEDDVQIISNDCLLNCKYAFTFTVVDVNTSGTVNKREITFNGNTGDTGELNINIPSDSISSDEQILSDFRVDIVFDIHEYYTRPVGFNVDLSVDKPYIVDGESATVTALLTSDDGTPIESHTVNFDVNGTITSKTTDSTGKATLTITGDGTQGLLDIKVMNKTITIMDAYFFDENNNENWWNQNGDWNVTIKRNGFKHLLLTSNMDRSYLASTTPSIDSEPPLNELLSIPTPFCVEFDTDTVNYPNNIPSFMLWDTEGYMVFDSQLFMFKHYKIQIKDNTIKIWRNNEYIEHSFPLPEELYVGFFSEPNKFNAYVDFKDFIIYNLSEPEPPAHDYSLSVAGTSIIETGDFTTVTAILLDNGVAAVGETLNYEIKHGSTVIDSGSGTTDSNGQVAIDYTGTGVGDVDVIVSFGMSLQETFVIEDCHIYGDWNMIKTSFAKNTSVSGRTIYYPSTIFEEDIELSWKFKNNIPSTFLVGFAEPLSPYTTKLSLYRNQNSQYICYWSDSSRTNQELRLSINPSVDGVFKITTENIDKLSMYYNNDIKDWKNTITSIPLQVRIDDFNNTMELEYIKIKAL